MTDIIELLGSDDPSNTNSYSLTDIADVEWKSFALYTVESRAIPSLIDALKPVQRFYLYSSIKNTRLDFKKVSAVGGPVSDYGYSHGEASVTAAGQLMAAEYANNVCLVKGRGSFGTRLIQTPAAARYTQTKLHDNFHKYIKDIDLAPEHPDPEHLPPKFYLPVIPLVLCNGVKGIATGFATSILPRDPADVIRACSEYIRTGKIKDRVKIKFPQFTGTVTYNTEEDRYYCTGTFERLSKTQLMITEVPYGYDRVGYIKVLDKLEDDGHIVGYEDMCDKTGFNFEVKLKNSTANEWDDEQIIKGFKLSKVHTENIMVIDQNGDLKKYETELDLIKDFCDYRFGILDRRIALRIEEHEELSRWLKVKSQFIQAVLDDIIVFKGRNKADISKQILDNTEALETDIERILRINIANLTAELVAELAAELVESEKELKFWNTTTSKKQFKFDLAELEKATA